MKKLSSTLPHMVLSLTLICLVMAAILGLMNHVTAGPIKDAETKAKNEAIKNVVPEFDNNPMQTVDSIAVEGFADKFAYYTAKKGEQTVGYAIECYTDKGFSGRIDLMIGFDMADHLVNFSVLKHAETPGLGAKIQEWFTTPAKQEGNIQDVRNLDMQANSPLMVTKDGGKVDAITAATISSRAFIDAVSGAYRAYQQIKGVTAADAQSGATPQQDESAAAAPQEGTATVATAAAQAPDANAPATHPTALPGEAPVVAE